MRKTLALVLLLALTACHGGNASTQASPAEANPTPSSELVWPTMPPESGTETGPPMDPALAAAFSPEAEAGATMLKPVDPHAFTPSELQFGRPPRIDSSVTYQPNVLVMEHGDTAIRSMDSNGIVWHFDANAPQVDQIAQGKVIFATERCVGRVGAVTRNGNDVAVVLEPVQITDLIQQGHFAYNQPLDLSNVVAAPAPDIPVQFTENVIPSPGASAAPSAGASATPAATGAITRRFRLAAITYAVVSPTGKWTPFRVARYDARGRVSQHFLQRTSERVAQAGIGPGAGPVRTGIPAPAPGIGQSEPHVEVNGMDAYPCVIGCGGLGIQLKYSRNGINLYANTVFFMRRPNVEFNVDIGLSGIRTAAIWINGAAGFTTRFDATASSAFSGNVHILNPIPMDLTLPLNFAAPIGVHVIQDLALSTGFSARTSVLSANITFQFCCQIAVGYVNGAWQKPTYPQFDVTTTNANVSGVSVGINSLVYGMSQELLVGLGFAGFSTGPYISIAETMTALKQSSTTTVDCRQATLDMALNAGVGYTLPSAIVKVVNVFLTLANAQPLSSHGSLLQMPVAKVAHYTGSLPHGCAGVQ